MKEKVELLLNNRIVATTVLAAAIAMLTLIGAKPLVAFHLVAYALTAVTVASALCLLVNMLSEAVSSDGGISSPSRFFTYVPRVKIKADIDSIRNAVTGRKTKEVDGE